jgi:hypothetical protein
MRSFSRRLPGLLIAAALSLVAARASAQAASGFAVERFYPSAPGGGWFVMDDLDLRGGLGGAVSFTSGYARGALRVPDGAQRLDVVSNQAFAAFALAVSFRRWRLSLDLNAPLVIEGESGTAGAYQFTSPSVTLGSHPDTLADPRLGIEGLILGDPQSRFRLGVSGQLIIPNGDRFDYDTDGTFRAMLRALAAGDVGRFVYAGQLGVHIRPRDDAPTPGGPDGSELLFGVAGGARVALNGRPTTALVVGPEIYGATAFRSFLGSSATALEGLLTGRIEGTADRGRQIRLKLGVGAGLHPDFGAPEWRVVVGIEAFNRNVSGDLRE